MTTYRKHRFLILYYFITTIFIVTESCYGRFLPIPKSLQQWDIYHVDAKQLPKWSCGYNTLYNAANLEHYLSLKKVHNFYSYHYSYFKSICLRYLSDTSYKPSGSSNSRIVLQLAKNLKLEKSIYVKCHYQRYNNPLEMLRALSSMNFHGKQRLSIKRNRYQKALTEAQKIVNMGTKNVKVIHFFCFVQARGPHAILVSLVQFSRQHKALFIFDNLNDPVTVKSDVYDFLESLCRKGLVSKKQSTKKIPTPWQNFPVRF